jgi:hypothetical protein
VGLAGGNNLVVVTVGLLAKFDVGGANFVVVTGWANIPPEEGRATSFEGLLDGNLFFFEALCSTGEANVPLPN